VGVITSEKKVILWEASLGKMLLYEK
jgi:WD40 repeat protein